MWADTLLILGKILLVLNSHSLDTTDTCQGHRIKIKYRTFLLLLGSRLCQRYTPILPKMEAPKIPTGSDNSDFLRIKVQV